MERSDRRGESVLCGVMWGGAGSWEGVREDRRRRTLSLCEIVDRR